MDVGIESAHDEKSVRSIEGRNDYTDDAEDPMEEQGSCRGSAVRSF